MLPLRWSSRVMRPVAAALCVGLCSPACSDSPAVPTVDALEIRSASPPATIVLTAGFEQTFTYVVRFTLTSERAVAGLLLVPDGLIHLAVSSPLIPVGRGTTTATLTQRMLIPAGTRRLDVLIAMEPQDRISQTSITVTYEVQ